MLKALVRRIYFKKLIPQKKKIIPRRSNYYFS